MTDRNFIPGPILAERRRRGRETLCLVLCATYAVLVVVLIGWLRAPMGEGREQDVEFHQTVVELQRRRTAIEDSRRTLRRAENVLTSREHLTGRPDWGALLAILGDLRREGIVLTHCGVQSDGGNLPIRVSLRGLAPSQEAVSRYVVDLERLRLFDEISLRRAKREPIGEVSVLSFEIVCDSKGAKHD